MNDLLTSNFSKCLAAAQSDPYPNFIEMPLSREEIAKANAIKKVICEGPEKIAAFMRENQIKINDVVDSRENTLLHYAVDNENALHSFQWLLVQGANVMLMDYEGRTAAHRSAISCNRAALEILIAHNPTELLFVRDYDQCTIKEHMTLWEEKLTVLIKQQQQLNPSENTTTVLIQKIDSLQNTKKVAVDMEERLRSVLFNTFCEVAHIQTNCHFLEPVIEFLQVPVTRAPLTRYERMARKICADMQRSQARMIAKMARDINR